MSHRLAEAWHPALRRVSPTLSAATPEGRLQQKTMNLHHRNVPWLFGEQGQSLGRIHASPAALTQRSHSLTRKWTINRTMRWVSRACFFFFIQKRLFAAFITRERSLWRKVCSSRLDRVGAGDKALIGGKEVEALLVGLVSGEAFAAAFLRIKGVIPHCMWKRIRASNWVVVSHLVLHHRKQRSLIKFPQGLAYNQR